MSRNGVYNRAELEGLLQLRCDARQPVRLPGELKAAMQAHAAGRGEDVSGFVRRAIVTTIVADQVRAACEATRAAVRDVDFRTGA